jgi:hypothetical protein
MVFIDALASKAEMQEFCRAVPGTPKMVRNIVYKLNLTKSSSLRADKVTSKAVWRIVASG